MSRRMKRVIGLVLGLMAGVVQAAVVGLNTFTNDYTGANVTTTLSSATTNGFKITYDTVASGNSFAIASAGLSGGPKTLAIGESAVLSFTYSSTKTTTMDLGFRWGIDFGDAVIQMRADCHTNASTFLQVAYITANGSTTNYAVPSGSPYSNFSTPLPDADSQFRAGNSVAVTTTITRTSATEYTAEVVWGGQTYSSMKLFAPDHSIDSFFIGNGKDTGGGVTAGDNFTISGVSLKAGPVKKISLVCIH